MQGWGGRNDENKLRLRFYLAFLPRSERSPRCAPYSSPRRTTCVTPSVSSAEGRRPGEEAVNRARARYECAAKAARAHYSQKSARHARKLCGDKRNRAPAETARRGESWALLRPAASQPVGLPTVN